MKFTKILILILALSMLLVSCGGNGDGTVTTKPDGSTVNPPEPSDDTEYIRCGDELIDISKFGGLSIPISEFIWYYPQDVKMKEHYSSYENTFIIQFTATDYAEAEMIPSFDNRHPIETKINGTVDKVYYAGKQCALEEGGTVDITTPYKICWETEDKMIFLGKSIQDVIFRKGYSYIIAGVYEDGRYCSSPDTFELSDHDDNRAFYEKIYSGIDERGRERLEETYFVYREAMIDIALKNFPPVEPTKLEN